MSPLNSIARGVGYALLRAGDAILARALPEEEILVRRVFGGYIPNRDRLDPDSYKGLARKGGLLDFYDEVLIRRCKDTDVGGILEVFRERRAQCSWCNGALDRAREKAGLPVAEQDPARTA